MDFSVAKSDFNSAVRQILQGRKESSRDIVDVNAGRDTVEFVVTGRSVGIPAEAEVQGSASVPIDVIFKLKRIGGTYQDETFRIRIADGKLRFQGMAISNPAIAMRNVARRVIDIPAEAANKDILSLPFIFTGDEIRDSELHKKLLNAQKKMMKDLDRAHSILEAYGFEKGKLGAILNAKLKVHAESLRAALLRED